MYDMNAKHKTMFLLLVVFRRFSKSDTKDMEQDGGIGETREWSNYSQRRYHEINGKYPIFDKKMGEKERETKRYE